MKNLRSFIINFGSLAEGEHRFDYHLSADFLAQFEQTILTDADIAASVLIEKRFGVFTLHLQIEGTIPAVCDRCAEDFSLPIQSTETLLVKFVDDLPEDGNDTEVIYLEHGTSSLNVAQPLYELLLLSVPSRMVHPNDEAGNSTCNPDTLAVLNRMHVEDKTTLQFEDWDDEGEELDYYSEDDEEDDDDENTFD